MVAIPKPLSLERNFRYKKERAVKQPQLICTQFSGHWIKIE